MFFLDYDFTDKLGGTIRYSEYEMSNTTEGEKFTIAPNFAITESLGSIIEYSTEDRAGTDIDTIAIELTYTFKVLNFLSLLRVLHSGDPFFYLVLISQELICSLTIKY